MLIRSLFIFIYCIRLDLSFPLIIKLSPPFPFFSPSFFPSLFSLLVSLFPLFFWGGLPFVSSTLPHPTPTDKPPIMAYQLFMAACMHYTSSCTQNEGSCTTCMAPGTSKLHEGRSTRGAPRGALHADLFNTDVRSILMILRHFKGTGNLDGVCMTGITTEAQCDAKASISPLPTLPICC